MQGDHDCSDDKPTVKMAHNSAVTSSTLPAHVSLMCALHL
jgi:hypothetical protein